MPDLDELRGTLQGSGGRILDGMVEVARAGKWSHRRYEPQGQEPFWTTDVEGVNLPRGTYRLRLEMGDYQVDLRRATWDGTRFTGPGGAEVRRIEEVTA